MPAAIAAEIEITPAVFEAGMMHVLEYPVEHYPASELVKGVIGRKFTYRELIGNGAIAIAP